MVSSNDGLEISVRSFGVLIFDAEAGPESWACSERDGHVDSRAWSGWDMLPEVAE